MDIGSLSISMHQSSLKDAIGISLMKMSMDNGKEIAANMAEMLQTCAVDTTRGQILDVKA